MKNPQKQAGNRRQNGTFSPGNKVGQRFAPGESGNPAGRPRLDSLTEALREQLAEAANPEDSRTVAEHLARALIKQGMKGNVAALSLIGDRCEGKPKQSLDVDLSVRDWREMARSHGLSLDDVKREAELLLREPADDLGGSESDRAA